MTMTVKMMSDSELAVIRYKVLLNDFRKIDSVISRRDVATKLVASTPFNKMPPAWSELKGATANSARHEVSFCADHDQHDVDTVEGVIALTGLNYHELAHVLYTQGAAYPNLHPATYPPQYLKARLQALGKYREQQLRALLEDQRIERLFLREYAPTKPYFLSVVGRYLLSAKTANQPMQYLLIGERKYIPESVRMAYRAKFKEAVESESIVQAVERLMHDFVTLPFTNKSDVEKAERILETLVGLLTPQQVDDAAEEAPFHGGSDSNQAGTTDETPAPINPWSLPAGPPPDKEEREENAAKVNSGDGDPADDEDDDEDDEAGKGSGGDTEGGDDEDGDAEGAGSGDGEADDSDSDSAGGGSDSDSDSGSGSDSDFDGDDSDPADDGDGDDDSGSGMGAGDGQTETDVATALGNMVRKAEGDKGLVEDVANKQRALRNLDRKGQSLTLTSRKEVLRGGGFMSEQVTPDMVLLAKRVASEFRQVAVDLDPGRVPYQASGTVSMKRAMKGVDYDTVFDSWDAGQQDASDMEVVLLADMSVSMAHSSGALSKAMWIVQRALQQASSTTTVSLIGYGDNAGYVQGRGEQASPSKYLHLPCQDGGTDPKNALAEARALFSTTRKPKKVLIIMTDGAWSDAPICNDQIATMNEGGVTTATFLFTEMLHHHPAFRNHTLEDRAMEWGHGAQVYLESQELMDLIGFAKKVVTTAMKEQ